MMGVLNTQTMQDSVLMQLFLICGLLSLVLTVVCYVLAMMISACILSYAIGSSSNNNPSREPGMQDVERGLSVSELEKLPKVVGKESALGCECAVCLEGIRSEEAVRVMPGCKHAFHLECADTWLSRRSVCPLCRSKLHILLSGGSSVSSC